MATWADVVVKQNQLIRKALDAAVFLAPLTADVPTTIVDAAGGPALPVGFMPLGNLSGDGITWAREVETSGITSLGSVEPTRSDIRSVTNTVQLTAQETNRLTIESTLNVDLSTLVPKVGGEVTFEEPNRPKSKYYRLLGLAVDDGDAGEIYIGRLMPRVKMTETGDQVWSDGDDGMVREMTFQSFKDAEAGFSARHFFGGPGWAALLADMGFLPAATT